MEPKDNKKQNNTIQNMTPLVLGALVANIFIFSMLFSQNIFTNAKNAIINNPTDFNLQKIGKVKSQKDLVCKKGFMQSGCFVSLTLDNGKTFKLRSPEQYSNEVGKEFYVYFNSNGDNVYCVKNGKKSICGFKIND